MVNGILPHQISRKVRSEGLNQWVQVPGTARNMDMVSGVANQLVSKKMKATYKRQNRKVEGSWIYAKEKERLPLASLLRERNKSMFV